MDSHTNSLVRALLSCAREKSKFSSRAGEEENSICCGMAAASASGKRPRKAYTITRPREKWTADEHDRFLHALQLFGRDWKSVERFVATKTATQIRSHAQKHFLRSQKQGLAAASPRRPRAAFLPQPSSLFMEPPNCGDDQDGASRWESLFADALLPDETAHLPLSPDDPRFAHVYRFIGDVFGAGEPLLDEARLQILQRMDPVVSETILLVLMNLEVDLFA